MRPIYQASQKWRIPRLARSHSTSQFPAGFLFWPNWFSDAEQRVLLGAALHKLDNSESRQARVRRKKYWSSRLGKDQAPVDDSPAALFAPDEMYEFQKGHFDGVIHDYREMHVSDWPIDRFEGLKSTLDRLYSLCPTQNTQTHILHLASYGEILPHVDNIEASGRWILGVSLGSERTLHLKENSPGGREFSLALPSGSVYLQRDDVRYGFLHSISRNTEKGHNQRLSVMIRDR